MSAPSQNRASGAGSQPVVGRPELDQLANQLDAAMAGRDFYAARAIATMLTAFAGGHRPARVALLLARAPILVADDDQDDTAREAAWLATLPPRRRRRRHDQPQAR